MTASVADRRSQRRDQILAAAWEIAAESGLAAVTLHEVARRVGVRQPSLYGYVASKLDLYDAMYGQAYAQLLARLEEAPPTGTAREQLAAISRVVLDFTVENPPRQQLLFQRTLPGFEPSETSYALAQDVLRRMVDVLTQIGLGNAAHVDLWTALTVGLATQQLSNDPGGDRWRRLVPQAVDMFLTAQPAPVQRRSAGSPAPTIGE